MGLCLNLILFDIAVILILIFAPGIPPYHEFHVIQVPYAQELKGLLAPNDYLDYGVRLHEGLLHGPESFAVKNDEEVFVGLVDGNIAKVWGKHFENLKVLYTPMCDETRREGCGRPLGLRYLADDKILVADAVLGLYIFDAKKGTKKMLVSTKDHIEDKLPLVINDVDIDKDGNIYWSHSSSTSDLNSSILGTLVGPDGRLLKYHAKERRNEVLLENLYFANGVQLSPDESFVLVAECMSRQVHRYWLKGAKKGQSEIFITNLPGSVDNIRARPDGGYYISLVLIIDPNRADLMQTLGLYPIARRFLVRVLSGIKAASDLVDSYFPNSYSKSISSKIFHFELIKNQVNPTGVAVVLEVDEDGNILRSLQGKSGIIQYVSETQRVGNYLLFGSPFENYMGRLDIETLNKLKKEPKLVPPAGKREEL